MTGTNQKLTSGAIWMVLFKWTERLIGFASTLVLARLLVPADFGLVAMATSVIALLEVVGYLGVDSALIQRTDATRAHYDTAWTFNILIGLVIAVAACASSQAVARLYADPRVVPILWAMALASLLQSAENIGTVNFRKEMDFRREFNYQALKKLVSLVTVVPLAFALRSYWALVIGTVVARFAGLALSFWMSSYRPRLSLARGRELFVFSRWMLLGSVVVFVRQRSSDFVIGRLFGAQSLGLYNIAAELGTLPATEVVMPVSRAAFPVYSAIAYDRDRLADIYHRVLGLVALVALPAGFGLAATADVLVPLLYGPNWAAAIPVAALLGLYGIALAVQGNIFPLFLAVGRPQVSVWVVAIQLACLLPMLVVLTRQSGISGAAAAYVVSGWLSMPVALYLAARELRVGIMRSVGTLWRPLAASCAMFFALSSIFAPVGAAAGAGALSGRLALEVASGVALFLLGSAVLWLLSGRPDGAERSAMDFCLRQARRWAGRERA